MNSRNKNITINVLSKTAISNNLQELELKQSIEHVADELAEQEANAQADYNKLINKNAIKPHLKEEYINYLSLKNLGDSLTKASSLIVNECKKTLKQNEINLILTEFTQGLIKLSEFNDFNQDRNFQEISGLSQDALDLIEKIATQKYSDHDYQASKELYILLSLLNTNNLNYWCKLGINYQFLNSFKQAIQCYEKSLVLSPSNFQLHLFISECQIELGEIDLARLELIKAKKLIDENKLNSNWHEYFLILEQSIKNRLSP